jgi:DNA-directed RNA polymerase subunit RPC12/RpoP
MKHIKKFESLFDDKPIFNFDQTFHIANKKDISSMWSCSSCDHKWENFNKFEPIDCPNCKSAKIKEIPLDDDGSFMDLYNLKKTYEDLDTNSHKEVIEEVKKLIESTIEKSGGEFNTFIESYIKDPEKFKIEGLINDSDIYDFYLKYRNSIDEILNDVNFYDEPPSELNTFGLYDYIIIGTSRAINEIVKMIK